MAGGAPKGNRNAANGKRYQQSLWRCLARSVESTADDGLDKGNVEVVKAFHRGEPWAVKLVAERLDGLPDGKTTLEGTFQVINEVVERGVIPSAPRN